MGYERSPLAPAMAAMLTTRRPSPVGEQALGWMVEGKGDDQLVFHDGGRWVCQFNGVGSEEACRGCRALQSRRTRGRHTRHLLRPSRPLAKPSATKRIEIALDSAILDSYAGRYISGADAFIITKEGAS